MNTHESSNYIPAAGHDWLLPLYDPCIRILLPEKKLRGQLIEWTEIAAGTRVLDLGCGTGTLAVMAKSSHPQAEIVGLDGDPKALRIARRKAEKAAVEVRFEDGLATALPYQDSSFGRVISSFVFHHLGPEIKRQALSEIRRVLEPGGLFLLQDFGPPTTRLERWLASRSKAVEIRENLDGKLPSLIREAGFASVEELGQHSIRISRIWTYRAA